MVVVDESQAQDHRSFLRRIGGLHCLDVDPGALCHVFERAVLFIVKEHNAAFKIDR